MNNFEEKIKNKNVKIGIIGLGYVGLPLAIVFCNAGIEVVGIDTNVDKVRTLKEGKSYIGDVSDYDLKKVISKGLLSFSTEYSVISDLDAISICVPTPLNKTKEPDISYIQSAIKEIKKYLHKDMIITLESTTYPGTTEEIILPYLEKSGLTVGKDYFLAFSPERVDPANATYTTKNTPKILGGVTEDCTRLAKVLYQCAIDKIISVSSTQSAEVVKLFENTFRAVNIGLVNELALICDKLDVDVWEIIDAAKTKPFGFMPFYPGPGLGGHCIPIDPLYLTWKLKTLNTPTKFISLADDINTCMPSFVVNKSAKILNLKKKALNGSKILVLGVAYKKNINDFRESPALEIISQLYESGASVHYSDKFINKIKIKGKEYTSENLSTKSLEKYDLVIITTDHDYFDWSYIVEKSCTILDTRNALKNINKSNKIFKL